MGITQIKIVTKLLPARQWVLIPEDTTAHVIQKDALPLNLYLNDCLSVSHLNYSVPLCKEVFKMRVSFPQFVLIKTTSYVEKYTVTHSFYVKLRSHLFPSFLLWDGI